MKVLTFPTFLHLLFMELVTMDLREEVTSITGQFGQVQQLSKATKPQ